FHPAASSATCSDSQAPLLFSEFTSLSPTGPPSYRQLPHRSLLPAVTRLQLCPRLLSGHSNSVVGYFLLIHQLGTIESRLSLALGKHIERLTSLGGCRYPRWPCVCFPKPALGASPEPASRLCEVRSSCFPISHC